MILIRREGIPDFGYGFEWPVSDNNTRAVNQIFDVEDHNANVTPLQKLDFVLNHLQSAQLDIITNNPNNLWQVTVLSAIPNSGCISGNSECVAQGDPISLAKVMNAEVYQFLEKNVNGPYGMIVIDFPGVSLIQQIVASNLVQVPTNSPYEGNITVIYHTLFNPPIARWVVGIISGGLASIILIGVLLFIYRDTLTRDNIEADTKYEEID